MDIISLVDFTRLRSDPMETHTKQALNSKIELTNDVNKRSLFVLFIVTFI